jgi:hypothetical protein
MDSQIVLGAYNFYHSAIVLLNTMILKLKGTPRNGALKIMGMLQN